MRSTLVLIFSVLLLHSSAVKGQIDRFKNVRDKVTTVKNAPAKFGSPRELKDDEKGHFKFNVNEYVLGKDELTATLELPKPPKYYIMKWCKKTSCDYDHDNLNIAVIINDELITAWTVALWDEDYTVKNSFPITVLPENDEELGNFRAAFNSSKLFKDDNPLVYAMYDFIYGGRLKPGDHTLKLKIYTDEVVPLNEAYENIAEYHEKWIAIAESTIPFVITQEGLDNFIAKSYANKLSHAGGDWDEIDNHLKNTTASGLETIKIIDVATTTQWKVTVNSLGVPIFRECKANIIYNSSEYGCRLIKLVSIKQDYIGNNNYGKPYVAENLNQYFFVGSTMVNHIHVPVPLVKVE